MLKLLKYFKNTWWEAILVLFLIAGQAYAQLELTSQMGSIVKVVSDTTGTYTQEQLMAEIWRIGGIMIGLAGAVLVLAIGTGLIVSHCTSVLGRNIRAAIYKQVDEFSLAEYDKFGTATLITRITNDVQQVKETTFMSMRIIIMSPVTLIVAIVKTLTADASLAIVLTVSIPLIIITIAILFVFATPLFKKIQTALDNVTIVLRESLTGVRVVRAFNQQKTEKERFDNMNGNMRNMIVKVGRTMSFAGPIITIIFDLTYIGIYFYGFSRMNGQMASLNLGADLANMMVVAQYTMQIMMSFMMFAMMLIMIPRAQACASRINAILDTKISILDPENPIDPQVECKSHGVVEFKDVTFKFPDAEQPTLLHINFVAKPGETTAIIGSTGSGKSSIINLIPRFYDASEGLVLVDGVNVKSFSRRDLRDKIGFVPQQALLFSGTIKDNLKFGKQDATDAEINEALEVAQAAHFVNKKELGVNSEVSQGGKNFSGGQKQRLAIARALVKKPEIYIFDDSFSALDFKTDIRIRKALKSYTKDASIIVVAQRVSSIIDADNIIVLQDGEIVGQGTHKQLLRNCPTYLDIVLSQLDPDEIDKTIRLGQEALEGGAE